MTTVSSSQSVQQNDRGVSGVHSGGMDDDDKFEEIQTRYSHVVQRYHLLRWWHRLDVPIVHRYTTRTVIHSAYPSILQCILLFQPGHYILRNTHRRESTLTHQRPIIEQMALFDL